MDLLKLEISLARNYDFSLDLLIFCAGSAFVRELLQVFFLIGVRAREHQPADPWLRTLSGSSLGALPELSGKSSLGALWGLSGSSLGRALLERLWGLPKASGDPQKAGPENGVLLCNFTPPTRISESRFRGL